LLWLPSPTLADVDDVTVDNASPIPIYVVSTHRQWVGGPPPVWGTGRIPAGWEANNPAHIGGLRRFELYERSPVGFRRLFTRDFKIDQKMTLDFTITYSGTPNLEIR
jgi:hypothetical protein